MPIFYTRCRRLVRGYLLVAMIILIIPIIKCSPAQGADKKPVQILRLRFDMPALSDPLLPPLTQDLPDADKIAESVLSIEPESPCRWVYSPGSDIRLAVACSDADKVDTAVLTVWDWENRPVARRTFFMPLKTDLLLKVSGRGTYVLTLDGVKDGKTAFRLVRSVSVCPPNNDRRSLWKKNGFWIGQCSFPGWQGGRAANGRTAYPPQLSEDLSRKLDAELVARMGAQVARIDMPVYRKDNEGFNLDFSLSDKCVKEFTSRGMELDLHLFMPFGAGQGPILPKYADVPANRVALYPIKEEPYRHYVRELGKRYGRFTKFIQVRNEPGNPYQYEGTAEDFTNEVRIAADEIHKLGLKALVSNGGYCNTEEATQKVIEGLKGLTDFASYHCHGSIFTIKYFFGQMQDLHKKAGYNNPRYANTEMGYYLPTVGGERTNAVSEMQKMLYCWAHGNEGVMLYSSRETWWPRQYSYDGISDYGFVDYFFCPRFVYGTVSAFIDRYAGFKFNRILRESDNLHVYEFRSGSKKMVAVFASQTPVSVKLLSDGKSASILDPMGNETQCADPRSVTVNAGEYPVTVVFDKSSNIRLQE
ncbi:MAG: hypothetical protein ACYC27_05100 [Armatimonadota bacterium]